MATHFFWVAIILLRIENVLFHNNKIIVLLAFLYKDILVIEQILTIDYLVKCSKFLLIYRDSTTLYGGFFWIDS